MYWFDIASTHFALVFVEGAIFGLILSICVRKVLNSFQGWRQQKAQQDDLIRDLLALANDSELKRTISAK